MKESLEPLRLILQLGALVVVATLLPLAAGVWLMRRLEGPPWILCISGVIALALTMTAVYQFTSRLYAQAERQRRGRGSDRPQG